MNSADASWLAGIIEGEGCLSSHNGKARISVSMIDEDVIQALYQKTGVGSFRGPCKVTGPLKDKEYKDQWIWTVNKREDVRSIIVTILPFLYSRRAMKALELLDMMDELDKKANDRSSFCPAGHSKPECLGINGGRHCLICRRERYATKISGGV